MKSLTCITSLSVKRFIPREKGRSAQGTGCPRSAAGSADPRGSGRAAGGPAAGAQRRTRRAQGDSRLSASPRTPVIAGFNYGGGARWRTEQGK